MANMTLGSIISSMSSDMYFSLIALEGGGRRERERERERDVYMFTSSLITMQHHCHPRNTLSNGGRNTFREIAKLLPPQTKISG